MAGKNQHYLPRFLLKGFTSRVAGKERFVWVITADGSTREPNVRNVAAERYFYGKPTPGSIDDQLTREEGRFAAFVDSVREHGAVGREQVEDAAAFVASLTVRTRNIRQVLSQFGEAALETFREHSSRPEVLRREIVRLIKCEPDRIFGHLLDKQGIRRFRDLPLQVRRGLVTAAVALVEDEVDRMSASIDPAVDRFLEQFRNEGFVSQSHLKSLAEGGVAPEPRLKYLRGLRWSVVTMDPTTFILGDVGVLRFDRRMKRFESELGRPKGSWITAVAVSDQHLLVGCRGGGGIAVAPELINAAAARLSTDFIVSSCCTERELAYAKNIGTLVDAAWRDLAEKKQSEVRQYPRIRERPRGTERRYPADPKDLEGSLQECIDAALKSVNEAGPVYFNTSKNWRGWVKRRMRVRNLAVTFERLVPEGVEASVEFDCELEQTRPFEKRSDAETASDFQTSTALDLRCPPDRGRVRYRLQDGCWIVFERAYLSRFFDEPRWSLASSLEPDAWPNVMLFSF